MLPPVAEHDADPGGGVRLPGLRVLDRLGEGVERVGVVDQVEVADFVGVELPVRDRRAVGAPAPAVLQPELFLVHPVEGAVDHGPGAVGGELGEGAGREVLDVEIVLADVSHPPAIRGELREHQGGRLGRSAELVEATGRPVERPVVAAGVGPPDRLRVREDQHRPEVRGPGVALDGEGNAVAGGHERLRGHQDGPRSRPGVVLHQVAALAAVRRGLERRVGRAVAQPPGRAERLGPEIGRGENPVNGEEGGVGLGRLGLKRGGGEERGRGEREQRLGESRNTLRVWGEVETGRGRPGVDSNLFGGNGAAVSTRSPFGQHPRQEPPGVARPARRPPPRGCPRPPGARRGRRPRGRDRGSSPRS